MLHPASPSSLLRKAFLSCSCSVAIGKDSYSSTGLQNQVFHLLTGIQLVLLARLNGEGLNPCSLPAANLQILNIYHPKWAFKWVPDLNDCIFTPQSILTEDNKILSAPKQLHSPAKFSVKRRQEKQCTSRKNKRACIDSFCQPYFLNISQHQSISSLNVQFTPSPCGTR